MFIQEGNSTRFWRPNLENMKLNEWCFEYPGQMVHGQYDCRVEIRELHFDLVDFKEPQDA